jgi:hypothetical protein
MSGRSPHAPKVFAAMAGAIWNSPSIVEDFHAICACGGRFAGTDSELKARELLAGRLAAAFGRDVRREPVPYLGWDRGRGRVTAADGRHYPAVPLGRSPATPGAGLAAEIVDLGRGTPADFAHAGERVRGGIVLVRHEYMLASAHIHRRRKYELAKATGAAGFMIACHLPGGLAVTGSAGTGHAGDIPAAGVSLETGEALAACRGTAVLETEGRFVDRVAENLFAEIPGRTDEWVVLCAHLDGHDLAASAIDNGSGLACVLAIAEAIREHVPDLRRGLRIALFNVEEWAMIGSRHHLERLTPAERRSLAFNVNLDSVAGAGRLAVMTSGIAAAESMVRGVNDAHGLGLRLHRPFMGNSDHGNFIHAGVPAVRLCAGIDEPQSNLRFLLTAGDTPDKVAPAELKAAATAGSALLLAACEADIHPLAEAEVARITSG